MPGTAPNTDAIGYEVDDLYVDLGRQRVSRAGVELPLSALSFDLLLALVRVAPNLLTFDQLMQQVWPGLVVGPETVSQRVKLVREALGDDAQAPRYVVGVRGRGYRMLAHVVAVTRETVAQAPVATVPAMLAATQQANLPPAAIATPSPSPAADAGRGAPPEPRRSRAPIVAAVAVLVLAVAVAIAWRALPPGAPPAPVSPTGTTAANGPSGAGPSIVVERPQQTIAVLPLLDLSPGGSGAFIGDGLAEELGYRLANVPGLHVAARSSAFAYRDQQGDVREIGRRLGVRHVIEGSVRRDGNRIRVNAQLVDTQTGYNVWAQSYDRAWRDVLAIQDDLARSIVEALQIVLSRDAVQRLAATTSSPAAFQRYLAGLGALRQPRSSEQLVAAERAFRDAIVEDPRFAYAHAGLCETYTLRYARAKSPDVAARAERACAEAVRLDPASVEVQRAQGGLELALGRSAAAVATFQAAIEQRPDSADGYVGLARAYQGENRAADAERTYRRAIAAEPGYWQPYAAYGSFLVSAGRPTDAAVQLRRLVELAPDNASALTNLGAALQLGGDAHGAAEAYEQSLSIQPTAMAYSNVGVSYYYLGRYDDAIAMFRRATGLSPDVSLFWMNLGDALAVRTAGASDARQAYRRAVQAAQKALAINPRSADERAQLAASCAALGDRACADDAIRAALEVQPEGNYVHYLAARVALYRQDREAALASLTHAVARGYPRVFVRQGPEFAQIRSDPRFSTIAGTSPAG